MEKELLNEKQYQKTKKKLLRISGTLLAIGICLSAGIIIFGIIDTNAKNSNAENSGNNIEKIKNELEEKKSKLAEEESALIAKKNELIAKGAKQSYDYNDGESYDLYILDNALDPSFDHCAFDEYTKNSLTKEYCSLRNSVEELEGQIETKQNSSSSKADFMKYIIMAVPAFMFPAMIALMLFITAKSREIMAFTTQQTMPVAQEGITKMAPTVGKASKTIIEETAPAIGKVGKQLAKEMAPVYGEMAKEITKGVKEGSKEAKQKNCKHCNKITDDDSVYCKHCGKKL